MSEPRIKSLGFYSLVCLGIVGSIGVFVWAMVIPNLQPAQVGSSNACINNLRQIDGAKNEWALETGKTNGAICTEEDITPYVKLDSKGNFPKCPAGGKYTIGKIGEAPTCSLGRTNRNHVLP